MSLRDKGLSQRRGMIVDRLGEVYRYASEARERGIHDPVIWLVYPLEPGFEALFERMGVRDLEIRTREFTDRQRFPAISLACERADLIRDFSSCEGFAQTVAALKRPNPTPNSFAAIATFNGASMTMQMPPTLEQARSLLTGSE